MHRKIGGLTSCAIASGSARIKVDQAPGASGGGEPDVRTAVSLLGAGRGSGTRTHISSSGGQQSLNQETNRMVVDGPYECNALVIKRAQLPEPSYRRCAMPVLTQTRRSCWRRLPSSFQRVLACPLRSPNGH